MSELAALIAQLTGQNQQPAPDQALAAVKLARASIDALVLKLGQTIDAKVVGQLAAGLTQLTAGTESFVLKLETPLPAGTAVTIRVAQTPQGTPAVTVSVPSTTPHAALPMPVPTPTAPLVQPQAGRPAMPQAATAIATPQPLPHATQLALSEFAAPPSAAPASPTQPPPAAPAPSPQVQAAPQPTTPAPQATATTQPQPQLPPAPQQVTVSVAQISTQPPPDLSPSPQVTATPPMQSAPQQPAPAQQQKTILKFVSSINI